MPALTLYTAPMTRGERVKRLLEAFGIAHEQVVLDYQNDEQKGEAHRAVHPLGKVPALKVGDQILLESGAICLALADLYPEKQLAPALGTVERLRHYEWAFLLYTTLEGIVLKTAGEGDKDEIKAEMKEALTQLSSRLTGPYALGDQFYAIDVMIHTELYWYKMLEIFPESLENWQEYFQRVTEKLSKNSA